MLLLLIVRNLKLQRCSDIQRGFIDNLSVTNALKLVMEGNTNTHVYIFVSLSLFVTHAHTHTHARTHTKHGSFLSILFVLKVGKWA
jgi:hypothetical protein